MDREKQEEKRRAQALFEAQEAASVEPAGRTSAPARHQRWWFTEAWLKLRPFFIDFVVEAVLFGLFLVSLEAFHRLVDRSSLGPDDKALLHAFHFYSNLAVLVIFGISFIIQVVFRKYEELFEEEERDDS